MNYITIDGHADDFNVKFATIPQTQLNSENFCVILSYVWEICTKPIKLHNEIGGLISSIQNKYPKVKIIVIFNSWYKDDIQEELLQPAKIVYIDYFLYRSYVKIVLEKRSQISNIWNNTASKFLFLTGKANKIHRIRLLHKLYKSNLLSNNCIWSLFYTDPLELSLLVPELSLDELDQFLKTHQRNPDNQKISWRAGNNLHVVECGMDYDTKLFTSTKFRVISESNFETVQSPWITEKTWITILNSQPFIMASSTNTLARLRDMGFRTFEQYLKISNYDQISDDEDRLDAIVENTQYWVEHINKFSDEIQEDITYNLNNYYRLVEKNMCVLRQIIKDYNLTCTELTILDLADELSFDKWYQSIRGADWPDCKNEEDLYKLPQWIKSECIKFGYKFIDSDVNLS
jgi:Mn-dependent DtxR family transcriptional regulator